MNNTVKVIILCGGMGTRLREETELIPKPMVMIGERPMLWHIMKIYSAAGFDDFVLTLGYKGDVIRRYFMDYPTFASDFTVHLKSGGTTVHRDARGIEPWNITLAETGFSTMTGGRVKRAGQYVDGDTFMVTYGDGVADINPRELLEFHRSHGKLATVTAVRPSARFGQLTISEDSRQVQHFEEKPQASEGWINGGFFVFQREVLDYLTDDTCVLEHSPLRRLAEEGQLVAFRHQSFWACMDTGRELQQLRQAWEHDAPWRIWE